MIEVLIAIVLASITVAALAQALLTLMMVSETTADRQTLSTAISGYSESLKQLDWEPCGAGGTPTAKVYEDAEAAATDRYRAPSGVTLTVTRIEYWDPSSAAFDPTCPTGGTGAQRLSILARSSRGTRTGQIVKVQW